MYGLALIYGFLAATAALLAQVIFLFFIGTSLALSPSLILLVSAAAIEEGLRLIFLMQLAKVHSQATSMLHALAFGIGFTLAELSLLALAPAGLPAFSIMAQMTLVHLFGTLVLATSLRYRRTYPWAPLTAFLFALIFHTLYNASL